MYIFIIEPGSVAGRLLAPAARAAAAFLRKAAAVLGASFIFPRKKADAGRQAGL